MLDHALLDGCAGLIESHAADMIGRVSEIQPCRRV